MNRNNNNNPSMNRNVVSPDYFVGEIWFTPNAVSSTGVEIIELNSSNSGHSDKTLKNESHSWSYANTNENFHTNKKDPDNPGDTRQKHNRNVYRSETNKSANNLYTHEYENDQKVYQFDHSLNLFTITNRQVADSDSSEYDQFDEIEVFEYDETGIPKNVPQEKHYYSNKQAKHATSFINNKIIPEIFQLDVPVDNDLKSVKFCDKRNKGSRAATPMPPSYIPKLDLTQKPTLSTVTEITEPNKDIPILSASEKSSKEPSIKIKANNDNRLSYLNWLGLSPRQQKRQKFRRQRKMKKSSHEVRVDENKQEVFFDAINHICDGDMSIKANSNINDNKNNLARAKSSQSKLEESKNPNITYVVNKVDMRSVASGRSARGISERNQTRFTEYGDEYDRTKCTQVTEEDIDRSYARFISRNSSSADFTERQSWLRRLLICFLCYK